MDTIRQAKEMLCSGDFLIPPYLGLALETLLPALAALLLGKASKLT